ncbi:MAG: P-loop NTPase fold protein, partial [Pseudomonadota bacterium]|nr:P-loop NTPase fold protein [Pseudomonadota bacterium]
MLLADIISDLVDFLNHKISDAPYVLAVSGGQGAGKSTMCKALEDALTPEDKKTLTLSLDDFYHSAATRLKLADTIHPLCATRGVPGTHDLP